jgi:hypothetical protein
MSTRSHHVLCSNYIWDNICLFVCKHYSAFYRSSYFFSFELSLGGYASPVVLFFTHWRQVIFYRLSISRTVCILLGVGRSVFSRTLLRVLFFRSRPCFISLFGTQGSDFLEMRENITYFFNLQNVKVTGKNFSYEKMPSCTYYILKIFLL